MRILETIKAMLVNGAVLALACLGYIENVEWAANLASFVLWILALLACALPPVYLAIVACNEELARRHEAKRKEKPGPYKWFTRPLAWATIIVCVLSGHFVLAIFLVTGTFLMHCMVACQRNLRKPKLDTQEISMP